MIAKEVSTARPSPQSALGDPPFRPPAASGTPRLGALRTTLITITLLALAACSILPEREPNKLYEPAQTPSGASSGWPQAQWSLLVARPTAGQLLDTDRIVVRPSAASVTVYKGASWADSLPELVQTALLRRFEDSRKILSVSRPGGGVRGEFQLLTELRVFESVYVQPGQAQAQVELYARLVHTADGQVVAARSFRETEAAAAEDVGSVVDAFSRALGRASSQVAGWTLQSGNQHPSDPPAHPRSR